MSQPVSYSTLVNYFNSNFLSRVKDDFVALVEQISLDDYQKIRAEINSVFDVGDCPPFTGEVADWTEFGDITDVLIVFSKNNFPLQTATEEEKVRALSVDERTSLRDKLIGELDDMVPR